MSDPAVSLRVLDARFGIRHVPMRMPFRFGMVTLTKAAQLHLFLDVETADGRRATGLAADMLAPKWYDKDPDKTYADNLNDLIAGARAAVDQVLARPQPATVYRLWRDTYDACQALGPAAGRNPLVAGNGPSLVERALLDGLGLALGVPYHGLVRDGLAGIELADLHPELAGVRPADVLAAQPRAELHLRHTVGIADPLRTADISAGDRLDDGLPQSLEQYIETQGIGYFKLKVGGDVEADAERLAAVAAVLEATAGYRVSLDGNEQYNDPAELNRLLDRLEEGAPASRRLYDAILYLEQPLDRGISLDPAAAADVAALSARKPMLIDESDEGLDTFRRAAGLGYRGVSSKACKGMTKALANLALCQRWNAEAGQAKYLVTGEDLTNIPVVALHQDLAHLAALGIEHCERNGHHYVRGLDHLPADECDACLRDHGKLYEERGGGLAALAVRQGRIRVDSITGVPGLGVGVDIDEALMRSLDGWRPEHLEEEDVRG